MNMNQYTTNKAESDIGSGNNINKINNINSMRCYLQNPSGIMKINALTDDKSAIAEIVKWNAEIIALPETNRNWNSKLVRLKWFAKVKQQ